MTENWREVYALSELIEQRILRNTPPKAFLEGPAVDRLMPSDLSFDAGWKERGPK
jgi:hypothetical protein